MKSNALKNEFKEILFGASEIHCAVHFFLKELVVPEWANWKTFINAVLSNDEELQLLLRPINGEKLRKQVFLNMKSFHHLEEDDFQFLSLTFSQSATLLWCYLYNKGITARTLALNCLELSEMMNRLEVQQMNSPRLADRKDLFTNPGFFQDQTQCASGDEASPGPVFSPGRRT